MKHAESKARKSGLPYDSARSAISRPNCRGARSASQRCARSLKTTGKTQSCSEIRKQVRENPQACGKSNGPQSKRRKIELGGEQITSTNRFQSRRLKELKFVRGKVLSIQRIILILISQNLIDVAESLTSVGKPRSIYVQQCRGLRKRTF